MEKTKKARKRLFSLFLVLAMALTSVSVPSVTAEAAKTVKVKKVQITNPKKKSVTLNKGKTLQIKVKITPKNVKNKKVTYKSSKKKVASVSKKGKVKGLKVGTAKITVTSNANRKKKATLTVKVVTPVSKVTVSPAAATINAGASTTLKASVTPKNAYNKKVNWTTSNKAVATVASNGVVKGVKAGTATITAKAADGSNKKASCVVTVKAVNPPASQATLESIAVTKAPDKTEYFRDDLFDPTGMEVTATYSDKTNKVLDSKAYQLSPSTETPLKTSDRQVTVSYTEGGITQTATTPITVKAKPTVREIVVKKMPTKTEYMEGDVFDPAGMEIEATLSDGTTKLLEKGEGGYTYSEDPLEVTVGAQTSNVTITHTVSSSRQLTAEVPVTVRAQNPLKSISVELKHSTLAREGASFSDDDVEVTATFEDNTTKKVNIADCSVDPAAFTKETTEATVSYWYGGIQKSYEVTGFVVTSYRYTYTFEDENTAGTLVKRENENGDAVPTEEYAQDIELAFEDNGVNGKALKMDGTYGLRLDKIAGTDSKSYSISMWVKPEVMAENKALIISTASQFGLGDAGEETWCALAGNSATTLKLWSHDNQVDYSWAIAARAPITSGVSAPWTHIVMTVDGTKTADGTEPGEHDALATLYVNGKKVGSGNVRNEKGVDMKTYFGVTGWKNDGYYKGLVDELVFTNEVLTEEEAEAYYLDNIENSGNTVGSITAVSADDGEEITVPYGTTLANVKRALLQMSYKAVAGEGAPIALTPVSDTLTVEDYTVTTAGEVETTVKLQAPDGYLFDMDGRKSLTITRTVKIKIPNPVTITAITPSSASVQVPYGASEDEIKEELAKLTFTVTTSDSSAYEISNAKTKWTLAEATGGGYTATFAPGDLQMGYKYADNLAPVTVAVTEKQAISITGLAIDPNTVTVAYGTSETGVKAELAKLEFKPTVATGEAAPEIANAAALWTIEDYEATTAGDYTAKATVAAPVGYAFADGVSAEVSVTVTVKPQGQHVLSSIVIETEPTRTNYLVGDKFDKTGMLVKAYYEDGQSKDVTSNVTIADEELALDTKSVTISYSEGEGDAAVTRTATQTISVVKVEEGMAVHYDFENSLADTKGGVAAKMVTKGATMGTMEGNDNANYQDGLKNKGILLGEGDDKGIIRLGRTMKNANFTINFWANPKTLTRTYAQLLAGLKSDLTDGEFRKLAIHTAVGSGRKDVPEGLKSLQNSFLVYNGGEKVVADVWEIGKWSMVTWSNSDSMTYIYVDGKEVYQGDNKVNASEVANLFIGGGALDDTFNGYVDEVSIYDSSLNQKQVTALYNTVAPTVSGITINAPEGGFTYTTSAVGEDDTVIQDALKNLKINVTMKNGDAPEFANNTNWTLTPTYNGAGTYTATKELTIPDGYEVAAGVKTTLEVPVTVKDVQLSSIAVTQAPNKVEYIAGEKFDKTGMTVTATYDDNSTQDVTDQVTITDDTAIAPEGEADNAKQQVSISYTEGDNTKTTTQEITVYTAKAAMLKARIANYTFDDTLENSVDVSKSAIRVNKGTDFTEVDTAPNYDTNSVNGKSILFENSPIKLAESIAADQTNFTINLWVKSNVPTTTEWAGILMGTGGSGNKQLMIYANPKPDNSAIITQAFQIQSTGASGNTTIQKLPDDTWTMLTWVNKGDTMEFYVDGVKENALTEADASALAVKTGLGNIYLGATWWDTGFKGNIDEVSIYNASLTEEQVELLHQEFATETP